MKTCSNPSCKEINPQPLDNFYKEFKRNGREGLWHAPRCKTCRNAAVSESRRKKPEKYNAYMRERRLDPAVRAKEQAADRARYADPSTGRMERCKLARRKRYESGYDLMYNYGLTIGQKQQMIDDQNGCCAICGEHESTVKRKLCVDHNHRTDENRGMLCDPCNRMLGLADDDTTILENAVAYLRKYSLKIAR